jgi:ribonuclease BN (tRNA processing enzyme)
MKIKILGAHIFESSDTKSTCLLVDDILAIDAGGLTSSLPFPDQAKIRAILLTHQHWDHVRDAISLAVYLQSTGGAVDVYAIHTVEKLFSEHLAGKRFLATPPENPTIRFTTIEPLEDLAVEGYGILPISVNHRVPAVGYQVTSPPPEKKRMFYTGDTTRGLAECWNRISPDLIFIEASLPNRLQDRAVEYGHLTPDLIKHELDYFRKTKGHLPQICALHFHPVYKEEIRAELESASEELDHPIAIGYEGMEVFL